MRKRQLKKNLKKLYPVKGNMSRKELNAIAEECVEILTDLFQGHIREHMRSVLDNMPPIQA